MTANLPKLHIGWCPVVPVWSGLAREPDREYVAQRASNYPLPATRYYLTTTYVLRRRDSWGYGCASYRHGAFCV